MPTIGPNMPPGDMPLPSQSPTSPTTADPVTAAARSHMPATELNGASPRPFEATAFGGLSIVNQLPLEDLNKCAAAVAQSPTVSEAFKKAFQTVHECLKKLWEEVAAPALSLLTNAAAIPLKATFLAVNYLVVLPISLLTESAIILAEKATGQDFKAAHQLPHLGLASVILSTIQLHPQVLKGDFLAMKEVFKGNLDEAKKIFETARNEALKALKLLPSN